MFKLYRVYLASSFILPLVVSTVFFVVFLLTFQLFRIMQLMSSSDVGISFLFSMIIDLGITLIPMALPISAFFSTIYCIGKISGDSEYIALRSFGLNKANILTPFIFVAFFMAVNTFFLTQELVPNANKNLKRKIKIISSASLIQGIKTGQFFTTIPNVTMFPKKVNEKTKELEDVFLQIYNPSKKEEKVIKAEKGKIIHAKDERTGLEKFELLLLNGNISSRSGDDQIEKILFKEYTLPISSKKFSYTPNTKEIMMSRSELQSFIDQGLESALKKGFSKKLYRNSTYEYWNRLNAPILILVFSFLGFTLGLKATRGRGQNSGGKAILTLISYYAFYFALVGMGKSEKIPMFVAVFTPTVVLFFYGYRKFKTLDWQS